MTGDQTAGPLSTDEARRLLEDHLARNRAEIDELRRAALPDGERPGFGKRAGDYVARVVDERTSHQLADVLEATAEAVTRALELIDQGRYGRCRACGDAIADARLRAVPWAQLCQRCQASADRQRTNPLSPPRHP